MSDEFADPSVLVHAKFRSLCRCNMMEDLTIRIFIASDSRLDSTNMCGYSARPALLISTGNTLTCYPCR